MSRRQFDPSTPATAETTLVHQTEARESDATFQASHDLLFHVVPGASGVPSPPAQAAALTRASGGQLTRASRSLLQLQRLYGNRYVQRVVSQTHRTDNNTLVTQATTTGLPGRVQAGLEQLSGLDLSGVRVHYNSAKPAQLQALAYTQGQDIHLGPGQEEHLLHEGWHAVQQMQGRVQPTMRVHGVSINDVPALEHEAEVMGAKALQLRAAENSACELPIHQRQENVAINDDRGLEHEADVAGAKALATPARPDGRRLRRWTSPAAAPIQGMFGWVELVQMLGPFAYTCVATLGVWAFYSVIRQCFGSGKTSKEEVKAELEQALAQQTPEPEKSRATPTSDTGAGEQPATSGLLREIGQSESQIVAEAVPKPEAERHVKKQEEQTKAIQQLIPSEVQTAKGNTEPDRQPEVLALVSSSGEQQGKTESDQAPEKAAAVKQPASEPVAEKSQASSRAETYLNALRNTNMWGGYAEANAIATNLDFTTRIFANNGGRLQLLANIGQGPLRPLSLLWTGDHYQVIAGNVNPQDPVPVVDHDPVGDGNCLFEAMFYIMRMGGAHVRELLQNEGRRASEVANMRGMAAAVLAQGDPALVNYLGEEMHQARKAKDLSQWKNVSDRAGIQQLGLYEQMLMVVYKHFPPKDYHILTDKKRSYFVERDGEDKKTNIGDFLRDNEQIKQIVKGEKNIRVTRSEFETWLGQEISYYPKSVQTGKSQQPPANFDQHSFPAADFTEILRFLEAQVPTSLNLVNCSQARLGHRSRGVAEEPRVQFVEGEKGDRQIMLAVEGGRGWSRVRERALC